MGAVLLVRHGQASFGAADYDQLSDNGRRQAVAVGAELVRRTGGRIGAALSGSLTRQRDTATAALAVLNDPPEVRVDPRWNEYDHIGLIEAHLAAGRLPGGPREFQQALDSALAAWVAAGDTSAARETWPRFAGRARDALADVLAGLGKGETAVVFTSGGVIAALAGQLTGAAGPIFLALNRVTVNGGISKVVSGRSGVSLLSFNEHGHFDGDGAELLSYR